MPNNDIDYLFEKFDKTDYLNICECPFYVYPCYILCCR